MKIRIPKNRIQLLSDSYIIGLEYNILYQVGKSMNDVRLEITDITDDYIEGEVIEEEGD